MFTKSELENIKIHLEYAKAHLEEEGTKEDVAEIESLIRLVKSAKKGA